MRITNLMMSNTMLGNINRNMRRMHDIENKITRNSMIGRPSDNPLVASRALRFTNTQSQIAQHQRNVDQATSWTEITEQAFNDLNSITQRLNDLMVTVDGVEDLSDKQKIATEINSLVDELQSIMNKSFAGRYIFSGLRTNEPNFLTRDQPNLRFEDITKQFERNHMETTFVMDMTDPGNPTMIEVNRIRLPHSGNEGSVRLNGQDIPSVPRDDNGNVDFRAIAEAGGGPFHNPDTGEIFLPSDAPFPLDVMYDQTGFSRGDLNPIVFSTATRVDVVDGLETRTVFTMDNQMLEFEFGVNTRLPINSLGKDIVTAQMFADLRGFANDILNKEFLTPEEVRAAIESDIFEGILPLDTDIDEEVARRMQQERSVMETITNDRFNNLIGRMDAHISNISVQHTELGTRMGRLEMISERLEDDSLVFEELATNNHGVDTAEMIMKMSSAEVALMASMQIGLNNMQMSLLNFL